MPVIRQAVVDLAVMGPMPMEGLAEDTDVEIREALIATIVSPVTDAEARLLATVLGAAEDSLFGLKWAIVHLIESAPGWPLGDVLKPRSPWIDLLRERARGLSC